MSKWKNRLSAIFLNQVVISVFGLIIIILIAIPLAKNISKRYAINNEIKGLEAEINDLEKKNTNIKQLIDYFKSDSYVEEQARSNLNLKKEGENVVVIKDKSETIPAAIISQTNENRNADAPNPLKWLKYFVYN